MPGLAGAAAAQYAAALRLTAAVDGAYDSEHARVRGRLQAGAVLAGDALRRWRAFPWDCTRASSSTPLVESLSTLLLCAVAAADERVDDAWRAEPAADAPSRRPRHRAGERRAPLRTGRTALAARARVYARTRCGGWYRSAAPDPETVAALVATTLLGGRRGRAAGEGLAERIGAHGALRACATGADGCSSSTWTASCTPNANAGLAPLDALEVHAEPRPNSSPRCPYCRRRGDRVTAVTDQDHTEHPEHPEDPERPTATPEGTPYGHREPWDDGLIARR
ncbi:hypothetical protein GCM10023238_00990 [Streptomyces heliomycini]